MLSDQLNRVGRNMAVNTLAPYDTTGIEALCRKTGNCQKKSGHKIVQRDLTLDLDRPFPSAGTYSRNDRPYFFQILMAMLNGFIMGTV